MDKEQKTNKMIITIKAKQVIHYDQDIEVSKEQYEKIKHLDFDDVSFEDNEYRILELLIDTSNVIDVDYEYTDVSVTKKK